MAGVRFRQKWQFTRAGQAPALQTAVGSCSWRVSGLCLSGNAGFQRVSGNHDSKDEREGRIGELRTAAARILVGLEDSKEQILKAFQLFKARFVLALFVLAS